MRLHGLFIFLSSFLFSVLYGAPSSDMNSMCKRIVIGSRGYRLPNKAMVRYKSIVIGSRDADCPRSKQQGM